MLEQKHFALLRGNERRGNRRDSGIRLCFEVLSLASAIDRDCARRLAEHGLSEARFVLLLLLEENGALSPHRLAELAGVTRATVTGLLDGLERDGFVQRLADAQDGRRMIVKLTARGKRIDGKLFDQHAKWIAGLFADFDAGERELLSGLLRRIWAKTDAGGEAQADGAAR